MMFPSRSRLIGSALLLLVGAVVMIGIGAMHHVYRPGLPDVTTLSDAELAEQLQQARAAWCAVGAAATQLDAQYVNDAHAAYLYRRFDSLRKETDARHKAASHNAP